MRLIFVITAFMATIFVSTVHAASMVESMVRLNQSKAVKKKTNEQQKTTDRLQAGAQKADHEKKAEDRFRPVKDSIKATLEKKNQTKTDLGKI